MFGACFLVHTKVLAYWGNVAADLVLTLPDPSMALRMADNNCMAVMPASVDKV